ncbi:MAG: hypothetical protein QNK04_33525 [Myxococcota bacterium]|nr:hypothetical protein [Myxococcota bacterium]
MPAQDGRRLTIPVETRGRELDAKLLLSCAAAERGFTVLLGPKRDLHRRMDALPRSVYLGKSLTSGCAHAYGLLERLGHHLVSGDEESLVYFSPDWYEREKIGADAFRRPSALLAWGPENERMWRALPSYGGAPIHTTGNTRIDLLRPELRDFFTPEVDEIRKRFGPFVLINGNFSAVNHYVAGRSPAPDDEPEGDFDSSLLRHKGTIFARFLELVPRLARAFPERQLVVRPHPSERHDAWRRAAAGLANVHVVHEGAVIPWLIAADVTLHNGCTTAVESFVLGRPAIAYRPATSEEMDLYLPNGLSHQAFDVDGVLELVAAALTPTGIPRDREAEDQRSRLLASHVASLDGPFAADRIAAVLEQAAVDFSQRPRPGLARTLRGRWGARLRDLSKRRRGGDVLAYHRHKFPETRIAYVEERIERLHRLTQRFSGVEVTEKAPNLFELRDLSG